MLFCAAQAPELFGRDQRYGVLPLYFSRALTRSDYALAKVGGLFVALLRRRPGAARAPVRRARLRRRRPGHRAVGDELAERPEVPRRRAC